MINGWVYDRGEAFPIKSWNVHMDDRVVLNIELSSIKQNQWVTLDLDIEAAQDLQKEFNSILHEKVDVYE